jgi:putative copper export protein
VWVTLDALHAFGALTWIGGLALLLPALRRSESGALLARFTPLAMAGAAVTIATGVARSWAVLEPIDALWRTTYGRILLAKGAVALLVLWFGWRNWRAHRGRHALDVATTRTVARGASRELLAASVVLLLTAWLTTASPSD